MFKFSYVVIAKVDKLLLRRAFLRSTPFKSIAMADKTHIRRKRFKTIDPILERPISYDHFGASSRTTRPSAITNRTSRTF